jgi:hypothetical protein
MIYTTNAIERLNMQVRKVIKNRGHFPNEEAAAQAGLFGLTQHPQRVEKTADPLGCGGTSICAEVWRPVFLPGCGDGISKVQPTQTQSSGNLQRGISDAEH